ncbi:MAG: S-methyl-5-thioribose-1-phosphate isomerase [Deltaproteobacteria bacterium]|nr:MAG: S-methyl-5-thioribose-1-phosphate isomerase [Deltaproteobacteria bacterium]
MVPTIKWHNSEVWILDQRELPSKVKWHVCKGCYNVIRAIRRMVIRGAPAIGIAAAMGLALGANKIRATSYGSFRRQFLRLAERMSGARPTAVNLRWAVERMQNIVDSMRDSSIDDIKEALRKESEKILEDDIECNKRIGRYGQRLVPKGATILTHCNAGALATGGYGTALGVIRAAHEKGKNVKVIADETRPWLQGLRLTSFELMEDGIPVTVIADNAAGFLMKKGIIDLVITGADRIASNGDVANKIGTYQVAVLARENKIPFYVAAPLSTIDMKLVRGEEIPVEERRPEEIYKIGRRMLGPNGVKAMNPAFDITPAKYVSAIITEKGIVKPPFKRNLSSLF